MNEATIILECVAIWATLIIVTAAAFVALESEVQS